jgi:hypothetical protein
MQKIKRRFGLFGARTRFEKSTKDLHRSDPTLIRAHQRPPRGRRGALQCVVLTPRVRRGALRCVVLTPRVRRGALHCVVLTPKGSKRCIALRCFDPKGSKRCIALRCFDPKGSKRCIAMRYRAPQQVATTHWVCVLVRNAGFEHHFGHLSKRTSL